MKNIATINKNEIFEAGVAYSHLAYETLLKTSILWDYASGIRRATINIFPSNVYNENGELVYDWQNGEVIQVNDIVNVLNESGTAFLKDENGEDMYFRVVDRTIKYNGQILIELQLEQLVNKEGWE